MDTVEKVSIFIIHKDATSPGVLHYIVCFNVCFYGFIFVKASLNLNRCTVYSQAGGVISGG